MNYALTVNADHIITGVHESLVPIVNGMFEQNPELAGDTVLVVDAPAEFRTGVDIRCYNQDGTLKPVLWCIENGYMEIPAGKEIINGELVDKTLPAEEQPKTLKEYLDEQFLSIRQETAPAQKAATVMFRALAQTDVLTPAQALENSTMFDLWTDRIGTTATTGEYLRHEDGLYRVQQEHTIQEHQSPSVHTAALYTRVQEPGSGPEPWVQEQSYAKGVEVTHVGGVWLSGVDNNVWEPGAPGVYDNVWKRVRNA